MTRRARGTYDVLRGMTADEMLSWPVVVTAVLWSLLRHLLSGGADVSGGLLLRLSAVLISCGVMFAALFLVRWSVLGRLQGGWRIVLTFVTYIAVGIVQGAVLQYILLTWNVVDPQFGYSTFRLSSGAFSAITILSVATLAVSTARRYRSQIATLAGEQERLAALLAESEINVRSQQAEATRTVEDLLTRELEALPVDSPDESLALMESLVADVVRPMSHELAAGSVSTHLPTRSAEESRVSWADTLRGVVDDGVIKSGITTACAVAPGLPAAATLFPPARGLAVLMVGGLAFYLSLTLLGRLLGPTLRRLAIGPRAAVLTLAFLIAVVPSILLMPVCAGPGPNQYLLSLVAVVAGPLFGWLVAVGRSLSRQVQRIDEALRRSNAALQWAIARNQMMQWQNHGQLSRALHGPVQSAVHVAISRLRTSLQEGTASPQSVAHLRDSLRGSLTELMGQAEDSPSLLEGLTGLRATWEGLVEISFDVPVEVEIALRSDPVCAGLAGEVIQEAVSNAVRHGGATHVSISIERATRDALSLTVTDDGRGAEPNARLGLGTRQLDDCALEWSRGWSDGHSRLDVTFALDDHGEHS